MIEELPMALERRVKMEKWKLSTAVEVESMLKFKN